MSVTHVAGIFVVKDERWVRQRCSWCGAILVDQDATAVGIPTAMLPKPVEEMTAVDWVKTWPSGALVTNDEQIWFIYEGDQYPDDACLAVDPAITV